MELNRRNFLKLSGTGLAAGLTLTTVAAAESEKSIRVKPDPKKIIYRTLGKTGIKVPVVSIGAMRADNDALMKAAIEAGMLHFDTAQSYQDGRNEEMLGTFFQTQKRKNFVIATKVKVPAPTTTVEDFLKTIDVSLKRLQTDYIDILYFHAVDKKETVLNPDLIKLLQEAKKSGKVKFIGTSTHRNMPEVINSMVEAGVYDVVLTSYNIKLDGQQDMTDALDKAAKAGLGIIAMKTMAGGFWDKERTKKINAKAALKWALQNENIHTSIPGITSFEQLDECASVMTDLTLTDEERTGLKNDAATAGLFCTGCEQCMPQCPHGMVIPDIMRSYMYAYGYGDYKLSHLVISQLQKTSVNCSNCPECNVTCSQGFDVQERARDILRIQNVPVEFLG